MLNDAALVDMGFTPGELGQLNGADVAGEGISWNAGDQSLGMNALEFDPLVAEPDPADVFYVQQAAGGKGFAITWAVFETLIGTVSTGGPLSTLGGTANDIPYFTSAATAATFGSSAYFRDTWAGLGDVDEVYAELNFSGEAITFVQATDLSGFLSATHGVLLNSDVINNLTSTDGTAVLSAAQGKVLNDKIDGLGHNFTFADNTERDSQPAGTFTARDRIHVVNAGTGDWVDYNVDSTTDGSGANSVYSVLLQKADLQEVLTAAAAKTLYESNPDTNAFTDAEQTIVADAARLSLPNTFLQPQTISTSGSVILNMVSSSGAVWTLEGATNVYFQSTNMGNSVDRKTIRNRLINDEYTLSRINDDMVGSVQLVKWNMAGGMYIGAPTEGTFDNTQRGHVNAEAYWQEGVRLDTLFADATDVVPASTGGTFQGAVTIQPTSGSTNFNVVSVGAVSSQLISGSSLSIIEMETTASSLDAKIFRIQNNGDMFTVRSLNDARTVDTTMLTVHPFGGVTIGAPAVGMFDPGAEGHLNAAQLWENGVSLDAKYLELTGGTLTGGLTVDVSVTGGITLSSTANAVLAIEGDAAVLLDMGDTGATAGQQQFRQVVDGGFWSVRTMPDDKSSQTVAIQLRHTDLLTSFFGDTIVSKTNATATVLGSTGWALVDVFGASEADLDLIHTGGPTDEQAFRISSRDGNLRFATMPDDRSFSTVIFQIDHDTLETQFLNRIVVDDDGTADITMKGDSQVVHRLNHDSATTGQQSIQWIWANGAMTLASYPVDEVWNNGEVLLTFRHHNNAAGLITLNRDTILNGQLTVNEDGSNALITIQGQSAQLRWFDEDAGTDVKNFFIFDNGGVTSFYSTNDANTVTTSVMFQFTHGGGVMCGNPTGGVPGTQGHLNANQLLVNNVAVATSSDEREKRNIDFLSWDWNDIDQLCSQGVRSWEWINEDDHYAEPCYGFSAQGLERAGFSDLVIDGDRKRVDKAALPLIAKLLMAVRELNERVAQLEA